VRQLKLLFSAILVSQLAYGHGEDKRGPHGGYIRMPGAFHTEVVETENTFRIYLLDIAWKNPTTNESSVQLKLEIAGKAKTVSCEKQQNYFSCPKPKAELNNMHRLVVEPVRQGQRGAPMPYEYPLKTIPARKGH